jgi:hypothetical protein
MPETAFHEVLFARNNRACSEGKKVDIVGVTGSIPVTPTIQITENKAFSAFAAKLSTGPKNLRRASA